MSEVLVRQLQQVLAPWDTLSEDVGATQKKATVESWGDPSSSATAFEQARTATTKLELARAALALFTSNAGAFRPVLVKVFRFLFDHIDALRDDVAHGALERRLWQRGESVPAAGAAAGGPSSALNESCGTTSEEQNAVVAAYEKVRLTESRMAALVEEASVQRDHFKSQIEAQKRQQYHLEDLLQHQMELTQTLLDHGLRQELVGGGASGPTSNAAGDGPATTIIPNAAPSALGDSDENGSHRSAAPSPSLSPAAAGTAAADYDVSDRGRRLAERRDAAYVQRLIARADRELTLEKTEDQLRELRAQQGKLESKVQSLLKLNTKYARQCVELSARLSIIHEYNIALAADVQLFQRDYVKEQQRTANLQHALFVARGIVLTTLQVQPGYQADDVVEQLEVIDKTFADPQWRRYDGDKGVKAAQRSRGRATAAPAAVKPSDPAAATYGGAALVSADAPPVLRLDSVDEVEEALECVPETELRNELKSLLQVDDVDHGGKVKAALLRLLELRVKAREKLQDGTAPSESREMGWWLSPPCTHYWAPPYGLRQSVPRHLRCDVAVPLLFVHPVLAEAFVHELLTQRQQLLAFAQAQREHATTHLVSQETGGAAGNRGSELQHAVALLTTNALVSFPDFIELFVLVEWFNRTDRYLPLLPEAERTRLAEVARICEEAYARRVSRLVAKGTSCPDTKVNWNGSLPAAHTSLWDLRHVLHLVRPSTESTRLPLEGLQLTYALDVASRQTNAGPLTYAYGLASRGAVCEVLLYVLRAERETLLNACRTLDAAMVAQAGQDWHRVSGPAAATTGASLPFPSPTAAGAAAVNGWVPTVQFIRLLLAMYPGYPVRKLEQLITAAVADGTTAPENPAMLFYETLLPRCTLPGPTAATTTVDTTVAVGTTFDSLFYVAICDDALASMQVVEDSVFDFVRSQQQQEQLGQPPGDAASDAGGASAGVTARQITANAFLGIPRTEARQWGAGLRSAIHHWPQLRSTFADPGTAAATSSTAAHATGDVAEEAGKEEQEEDNVSSVARVPAGAVAPYLRQNVIVRRGFFANSEAGVAGVEAAATAVVAKAGTCVPAKAPPNHNAGNTSNTVANAAAAAAAAPGAPEDPSNSPRASTLHLGGWTPAQAQLLQPWEAQWAEYSRGIPARSATATNTMTTPAAGAGAAPTTQDAFRGPSQVADFVELLQRLDPYRTWPWGSELVSNGSAVLHPLDYVGDWSAEVTDAVRLEAEGSVFDVASAKAVAKTGRKTAKETSGAR